MENCASVLDMKPKLLCTSEDFLIKCDILWEEICTRMQLKSEDVIQSVQEAGGPKKLIHDLSALDTLVRGICRGTVFGNSIVRESLKLLELYPENRVFYDVTLHDREKRKAHADAVLLTPYAVFTVKAVDVSSAVQLMPNGILQTEDDSGKRNLGMEMYRMECLIRECLGVSLPYCGILLFTGEDVNVADEFEQIPVTYPCTIVREIRKYDWGRLISQEEIADCEKRLRRWMVSEKHPFYIDPEEVHEEFEAFMKGREDK